MDTTDPTLTVLFASALAALVAAVGVVPLALRDRPPLLWIGWSNALAAGLMLGAAYMLAAVALGVGLTGGALLGLGLIHLAHRLTGTAELDLNRLDDQSPAYSYQILLLATLHAACEGIAIGSAMAESLSFGIAMAVAIAVHNVPEATVLGAVLRARGAGLPTAAGLTVVVNGSQILLAVTTFAIVQAAPVALPWVLGFAMGTLVHLVLVDLLPESYRQAGSPSIAAVASTAMGMVVLLEALRP